jgi:hypothetical protein
MGVGRQGEAASDLTVVQSIGYFLFGLKSLSLESQCAKNRDNSIFIFWDFFLGIQNTKIAHINGGTV